MRKRPEFISGRGNREQLEDYHKNVTRPPEIVEGREWRCRRCGEGFSDREADCQYQGDGYFATTCPSCGSREVSEIKGKMKCQVCGTWDNLELVNGLFVCRDCGNELIS